MHNDEFNLTSACVSTRLYQLFGIVRTPDTVRLWTRTGKLPSRALANGQRVCRPADVDELGARIAEDDVHADVA